MTHIDDDDARPHPGTSANTFSPTDAENKTPELVDKSDEPTPAASVEPNVQPPQSAAEKGSDLRRTFDQRYDETPLAPPRPVTTHVIFMVVWTVGLGALALASSLLDSVSQTTQAGFGDDLLVALGMSLVAQPAIMILGVIHLATAFVRGDSRLFVTSASWTMLLAMFVGWMYSHTTIDYMGMSFSAIGIPLLLAGIAFLASMINRVPALYPAVGLCLSAIGLSIGVAQRLSLLTIPALVLAFVAGIWSGVDSVTTTMAWRRRLPEHTHETAPHNPAITVAPALPATSPQAEQTRLASPQWRKPPVDPRPPRYWVIPLVCFVIWVPIALTGAAMQAELSPATYPNRRAAYGMIAPLAFLILAIVCMVGIAIQQAVYRGRQYRYNEWVRSM